MPVAHAVPAAAQGALAWLRQHALVLGTGFAAALPIVVLMIRTIAADWSPLGDNAIIAVRAYDVFTAHSPLLGQSSGGATSVLDQRAFSPGPLLFWLLAVPARFLDPVWMAVTAGLVNVASVMGTVALARRRGGLLLMFATAIAIPLMLRSIPAQAYSDVWNPWIPLMPFLLLIFLAWSLACGEVRLLPLAVLVGSFVAQTHLAFLLPAAGVMAVGLVGLVASRRRRRRAARSPYARRPPREQGPSRPWVIAAVVVLVVCWLPPTIDQVTHRPGNAVLLLRAASTDEPALGTSAGEHALVRTIGGRPWWVRDPRSTEARMVDLSATPGTRSIVSAVLVLAGLLAVALVARRRRRRDITAAMALSLVLCAIVVLDAAGTPERAFATVGYTMLWASPAGMFVWVVLAWSAASLLAGPRLAVAPGRHAGIALAATAVAGATVAITADPHFEPFGRMRLAEDRALAAVPPGDAVRVDRFAREFWPVVTAVRFQAGLVYSLRRSGRTVRAPVIASKLGAHYRAGPADRVLRVEVDGPPPRGTTIARFLIHPRSSSAGLAPQVVRSTSRPSGRR